MDLFKTILFSIILFSCQQEEPETWLQDPELRVYFDIVMDRLGDNEFPRDQIVLKSQIISVVATTYGNGIIFDYHHLDFAPESYIELVMLHEVLHAVYGWQPDTKKQHDIMWIPYKEHSEEEINYFYQKAKELIWKAQ